MLQRAEHLVKLAGVEACRAFFAPCLANSREETVFVAHLDGQARCPHLASYPAASGESELPVSELLRDAARLESAGVVIARKRRSGEVVPSQSDQCATRQLSAAAQATDVTLLDHLIFAGERCTSFRRMGLL